MARGEVTGRKPVMVSQSAAAGLGARGPPDDADAFTIAEFCRRHRVSQATYFALKVQGLGPVEMHVGRRRLISIESAARWRREREQAAVRDSAA